MKRLGLVDQISSKVHTWLMNKQLKIDPVNVTLYMVCNNMYVM